MQTEPSFQSDIEAKKAAALRAIDDKYAALSLVDSLGLYRHGNVIYYEHTRAIGFGYSTAIDLETARKIVEKLPPRMEAQVIKFVGQEHETFSPFIVKLSNLKGYPPKIEINYMSEAGYKINLYINYSQYPRENGLMDRRVQGKHIGFGNYDSYNEHYFGVFSPFKVAGGGQVMGCLVEAEREDFEYYIFNGKKR